MLLGLALLAGRALPAVADTFSVGSFTKSTNTSTPVSQAIAHGLGETPKALIIWSAGKSNSTLGSNARLAFGVSDTTTDRSASFESDNGVSTTAAQRRVSTGVVTMVDQTGALKAEASVQSVDATNFTLNWTTNNSSAYIFHFIAIGGTHIRAKVVSWTMRTSTGNQSVTGVGFQPDVVIHAHAGSGHTSSPSSTSQHGGFGLGAMDSQGNQWAMATFVVDGVSTSDTSRYQRTNRCLVSVGGSQTEVKDATFVSMDSNGFTINYSNANSSAGQVFSLALKGVQANAGTFNKTTSAATASQSVTGVPFRPRVVLFASAQDVSRTTAQSSARLGIGASNVSTEGGIAMQDTNGLSTTSVDGVDSSTKAFTKVNNNTQSTDAAVDVSSLDTAGFSLSWTTNDAVATEMLFLALSTRPRQVVIGQAGHPSTTPRVTDRLARASKARRAVPGTRGRRAWRGPDPSSASASVHATSRRSETAGGPSTGSRSLPTVTSALAVPGVRCSSASDPSIRSRCTD